MFFELPLKYHCAVAYLRISHGFRHDVKFSPDQQSNVINISLIEPHHFTHDQIQSKFRSLAEAIKDRVFCLPKDSIKIHNNYISVKYETLTEWINAECLRGIKWKYEERAQEYADFLNTDWPDSKSLGLVFKVASKFESWVIVIHDTNGNFYGCL
jgi:hypothetical protein